MSPSAQEITDEYQKFLQTMQDVLGVVVSEEDKNSVNEKLTPVMESYGHKSLGALAKAMRDDETSELRLSVLQAITANDSVWFAYPEIDRLMNGYVLPGIINRNVDDFRIWMVGCGQGQNAYSLAMVISGFKKQYGIGCNIEIVATDMSEETVKRAATGSFKPSMMTGLTESHKQKYMTQSNGVWEVDTSLRSMIHFTTCDLLTDIGVMGHFDLIICPDELIYFSTAVKSEILSGYAGLLDPSGMLIVGAGEPVIPFCDKFELVNHESGIFYRQLPDA